MMQLFVKNSLAMVLLILCAAVTSCSKGGENEPSEIPEGTSTFWSDAYRQHQLKGKVKTVLTTWEMANSYDFQEYDAEGNLIKDQTHKYTDLAYYSGLSLTYDTQSRLIKVVYGSNTNPQKEVAEFGYDGSHSAYIPTNIYSMEDLRLQKGVTSVKYKIEGKDPMEVKCTSVSGNRIVFEGTVGGLASLLGNISKVEVECSGNYPAHIFFKNMGTNQSEASVTFGFDGVPTKVNYLLNDGETVTTEYTTAGGFLQMSKQYESAEMDKYTEYQYNDKGYRSYQRFSSGGEYRYTYEYDSQGNWIKRTEEQKNSAGWDHVVTHTREYLYWN